MASSTLRRKVDFLVAVEVDRITPLAARHELRNADGTGEGAAHVDRVHAVLAGQQQELFEFRAEEVGAARVMEGQRRQRLEYPEIAGIAPVLGFDADDGDDDLGRHAIKGAGLGQGQPVFLPEADAAIDAALVQEARPVAFPGTLER